MHFGLEVQGQVKVTNLRNLLYDSMRSILSMLFLEGSGGMSPQENFEK